MIPRIKKLWVKALRSGKYKQGRNALCHAGRYCCLGVLCDIAVKQGAMSRRKAFRENCQLNTDMLNWTQCRIGDPVLKVPHHIRDSVGRRCAALNDGHPGLTFKQIARLIERTPAKDI